MDVGGKMIELNFEQLQLHRIFATCRPANQGSIRVLEKLGMRYEGYLREQKRCRGEWRDTVIYALLAHEWGAISEKRAK
jgi:RimJ/RimL family protein N-acetyltransferase